MSEHQKEQLGTSASTAVAQGLETAEDFSGIQWGSRLSGGMLYGHTALSYAASRGDDQAIRYLLSQGAEINQPGRAALHRPPLGQAIGGMTPLHAAIVGHVGTARLLVSRGADVNLRDERGNTALHCAVEAGNAEAVALLLEAKASLNPLNANKMTPLHLALSLSEPEIAEKLIEEKADVRIPDRYGSAPLLLLFEPPKKNDEKNDQRVIKLLDKLIKAGADLNVRDAMRRPVLARAVHTGVSIIVESVLQARADPFSVQVNDPHFQRFKNGLRLVASAQKSKKGSLAMLGFFHPRVGAQSSIAPILRSPLFDRCVLRDVVFPVAGIQSSKKSSPSAVALSKKRKREEEVVREVTWEQPTRSVAWTPPPGQGR